MSKPITISNTFQTQPGPIPLSQLDANFTQVAGSLNDMGTYSNYLVDSGAVNSLVVTTAVGLTFAYNAGMRIEVKVANTNTSTGVTINVNSLGAKNIVNPSGSALAVGQLVIGEIALLMYDGTNFQLLSASTSALPPLTGPLLLSDGTAGSPALAFSADTDTGFYRISSGRIGLATNGVYRASFSDTFFDVNAPIYALDGSVGSPSITFSADTDTGLFRLGTNSIAFAAGGILYAYLEPSVPQFRLASAALANQDGSAGSPSYTFISDPDTGIFRANPNEIRFSCGGSIPFLLNSTVAQFQASVQIQADSGSAGTPTYSFFSDPDTGIYRTVVANNLGIACGGTLVATFTPTQIQTLNGNIATGAGYAFNSNPLSGLYSSGSGQVGITVNGSGGLSLFDPSLGGNIASLGFNSSTSLRFNCTGASSATTGASGAPPAQVAGYMTIQHNGSSFKIPYYNV